MRKGVNLSSDSLRSKRIPSQFIVSRACETQHEMSKQIVRESVLPKRIRLVAGVDVAYSEAVSIGAAVSVDYASLRPVESKTTCLETRFPYVSTLLSFREAPPAVKAVKALHARPDILLVDGHGVLHPRRLGLASHLGLVLQEPTIGVAKNPLLGDVGEYNNDDWAPIIEKEEVVGAALATKSGKPIYISIGHMVSLEKAIEIVKQVTQNRRAPKPIHLAHNLARRERQRIKAASP